MIHQTLLLNKYNSCTNVFIDAGLANRNNFRVQRILRDSGNCFTAENLKQHFQIFFMRNIFLLLNVLFQLTGK